MTTQDSPAQDSTQRAASSHQSLGSDDLSEIKDTLARSAIDLTTDLRREGQRLVKDATQSAASLTNEKKSVAADYLRATEDGFAVTRDFPLAVESGSVGRLVSQDQRRPDRRQHDPE